MQITRIPERYSSAFIETASVFKISATAAEVINVDIYDHANTKVIGCKKFTGSTLYEVNIGNYVKQQIDVAPIRATKVALLYPTKRVINANIKIGSVTSFSELAAGVEKLPLVQKLSKSPGILSITKIQQDEISIRTDEIPITARITMVGDWKTNWFSLGYNNALPGITTIGINMKDVQTRLTAMGAGSISEYHTMIVDVSDDSGELFRQTYRIVEEEKDDIRLCWWNHYGQIDYYTMKKTVKNQFNVEKNRIYTATGYKTIASKAQKISYLASRYENIATMSWLSEIVASPRVWMELGTRIYPIEILSNIITTSIDDLSRLEISITDPTKITFQTT